MRLQNTSGRRPPDKPRGAERFAARTFLALLTGVALLGLAGALFPQSAGSGAPAEKAAKPPVRFDMLVREDFFAGEFGGDRARFDRAWKLIESTLAENPKHPQAMVWHGSGLLFLSKQAAAKGQARESEELWRRGLKQMDDAVALDAANIGVRLVRAPVLLGLAQAGYDPSDAEAKSLVEKGVEDYEVTFAKQRPDLEKLSMHSRGELLFGLAYGWSLLERPDKARDYLKLIVETCKGSTYEEEARKSLAQAPRAGVKHTCGGCH